MNIIAMKREAVLHPCFAVQSLLPAFYCELLPVSAASSFLQSHDARLPLSVGTGLAAVAAPEGANVT